MRFVQFLFFKHALGLETSYESGGFLFCVKSRETMIKRERFVW